MVIGSIMLQVSCEIAAPSTLTSSGFLRFAFAVIFDYDIVSFIAQERLKHDDSALLFNQELTYDTLGRLLDAAANVDTARYLDTERLLKVLLTIQADTNAEEDVRAISRRLISRLKGWRTLDDALLNTRADFTTATATVADIGREECSLGIWLQTMTAQPDILRKLAENPVLPMALTHPPPLLGQFNASVTHDEFIAFLRAYIGVACVLAVYAWADSVPNSLCQERALAILRLWQGMIGYREVCKVPHTWTPPY